MVTGLLALGPVALVLGLVARRRIASRSTRGRGLAVAGIVLGILGTLAWAAILLVVVLTDRTTSPLPTDVSAPRDAHVAQLVVGNCLADLPPDGDVDTVRVVPCADEHAASVVSEYRFGDDAVWPGQAGADTRVAQACVLSSDEQKAGDEVVTWAPTHDGWASGDRTGLCLVATG
ncbi:DUF4190 domain-containing protein [Cellulomonas sp. JH27-2]|nr:DUF4190 domain-containing protein [Cellulomonas sp. JH27-2]